MNKESFHLWKKLIIFVCQFGTHQKTNDMLVISTREFRDKQGKYLSLAKKGEDVVVKSRENGSFKLVPITEDDTLMSKDDFFAKIDRAKASIKEGKGVTVHSKKELLDYLDSL